MQHTHFDRPTGKKPIAIEIDGEPLGVVVRVPQGFRFLAVRYNAFSVDGETFDSVEAARQAVGAAARRAL